MRVSEDNLVPKDWFSDGKDHTVEEWGQKEYDSGRKAGFEQGISAAYSLINGLAADAFLAKKDDEARLLRGIAEKILEFK